MDRSLVVVISASLNKLREEMAKADAIIGTTSAHMKSMTNAYDGTRTISQANAAMLAVDKIGGATKLTEAEQKRLNATLTEGIAKYEAMGKTPPASMLALRDATKQNDAASSMWMNTLKSLGGVMLATFSVGAITGWVMKAVEAAGRIDDLSKKLGVSTDAVQRWDYAAKMGGSSIADVDKAVSFMNKTLAGGSTSSLEGALNAAKLKFADLRAMKPEAAFETIAAAIGKMEDPMLRARVALMLFGKSGQELLPAMIDGFVDVGNEADIMSQKTISALAEAGDEIDRWSNWFTVKLGGTLAILRADWDRFWGKLTGPVKLLTGTLDNEVATSVAGLVKGFEKQKTTTMGTTASIEAANAALEEFDKANKKNEDQLKRTWAAQDQYNAAVRDLADQFTGKKLSAEVVKLADALREAGGSAKVSAYEKEKLGKQLVAMTAQGATLTPELHKVWLEYEKLHPSLKVVTAGQSGFLDVLKLVPSVALKAAEGLKPLPGALTGSLQVDPLKALEWMKKLPGVITTLAVPPAKSFSIKFQEHLTVDLPKAIMGAIQGGGDLLAAAGSSIGGFLMSDNGIGDTIAKGAKSLFGDKLGAAIGSALPGLGAMVGPMISGLFGKLFGSAGRDSVESFAQSMGGFDALRTKLLPLGDVGERLWVNLTQGVGKNNPQQAQAAIQAITQALQEQNDLVNGQMTTSWQEAEEIMREFGISATNSGRALEQAKIVEQGDDIAVKWRKLIAAGVDFTDVTTGMSDEVQALINRSLALGIELPASLRKPAEEMIKLGLLTDENGKKLEDIGQLTFAETLTESVALLVKKLDEMIDALGGRLPAAISQIPKDIEIGIHWKAGDFPGVPGSGGEHVYDMADGGFGTVNKPTIFRVAEVPGSSEQFAFSGANKTFGSGGVSGPAAEDRKLQNEIAGLRSDMSMLMRDQPRAIAVAISDALALNGGRR